MKTEYTIHNNKAVINHNGKRITDFEPYFYVERGVTIPRVPGIKKVVATDKKNLYGKSIQKIITQIPSDVPKLRGMFPWTGEADIMFTKRYNIDNNVEQKNEKLLLLDIETLTPRGSRISDIGKYKISVLTVYNTETKQYHQFVQKPGLLRKNVKLKWVDRRTGENHPHNIYQFDDEKSLLEYLISYIKKASPDMIVDYSIDGYDMATIVERARHNKINYNLLSPVGRVSVKEYRGKKEYDIAGIELVPLIKYYKKWYPSELEQVDLHNICIKLFGIGKIKIVDDFVKEYEDNFKEFMKYNVGDVELLKNFIEYTKIIDNINYIIHGIGCEFEDYMRPTSMVRHYLLNEAKKENVVIDTWSYDTLYTFKDYDSSLFQRDDVELVEYRENFNMGLLRLKKKKNSSYDYDKFVKLLNKDYNTNIFPMKGAYVINPEPGMYKDVECFDWKSLYPSIMVAYNMSWETLVKYEDRNKYNKDDLFDIGNGVYFLRPHVKEGFLPKCISELFELRYALHEQMKGLDKESKEWEDLNTQQTVVKFLINSFYGVMKLNCIWIAESVTHIGRLMAKWTINKAEELGYKVVYGDTDSIYAICESSKISREKFAEKLCEEFDREWKVYIQIKYEGYFPKAMFIKKKKYILQKENGKLKPRGVQLRRSDYSQFQKDLLQDMILKQFNMESRKDIMSYIRDELEDIPNKKPTYVATTYRINFERKDSTGRVNPNKFDKAAMKANNMLNKNYMTNDKPYFLYDICFDYDHEISLTDERINYVKNKIYYILEPYFNMFGWDMEELSTGFKQRRFDI